MFTVKKVGHFVLFGLLAFFAFSSTARRHGRPGSLSSTTEFATTGAALLLFAAAAEVVQFLTTSRTPSLTDWVIDAGGVLLGGAVALMWSRAQAGLPFPRTNVP
jgi:VanZ family protein